MTLRFTNVAAAAPQIDEVVLTGSGVGSITDGAIEGKLIMKSSIGGGSAVTHPVLFMKGAWTCRLQGLPEKPKSW